MRLFRIWPFTEEAAREYARHVAALRKEGFTLGAIDLQIAAIALTLGQCTLGLACLTRS